MIEAYWNYSDIKNLSEHCSDAIFITDNDYEGMSISVNDIDTVIEELNKMKKEWEERHFLKELPMEFEFIVKADGNKYKAIISNLNKNEYIVIWINEKDDNRAIMYTKETMLKWINNKSWTIL